MLRPKWPPKEITKDFLSWILREVIPSLLCWTLESLGQNWGSGRWFEGWSKGDKTYGSKHEQSTECISYNVLLKGNGLYAKKKSLRTIVKLGLWGASICKPSVAPRRQYVPEPFHYGSPSGSQRIYLNSMHGGAFGWYIHKCEEMRGLKNLARISSDVCRRPFTGRMDNLWSFSDGEILCFRMAKNCKVSRVNSPKYMRNQDGYHGLNGNSGSLFSGFASMEDFHWTYIPSSKLT